MPTGADVQAQFLADNPEVQIESALPREGDSDNVYFHIRYRPHGATELHEVTWVYQRGSSGRWQRTSRRSNVRNRVISLSLLLGIAAALWCATYVAAMVFAPFAVTLAAVSVAVLARCAWRRKTQDPSDTAGALALCAVALAFAVSMFMPLWGHTGFRYNEAGEQVLLPHTHGILDADHIH